MGLVLRVLKVSDNKRFSLDDLLMMVTVKENMVWNQLKL